MTTSLKQRWAKGEVTLGAWCMIPEALTAEALGRAGFDWVLVDMQHGCMDYEMALNMIRAIDLTPALPVLRVPWNDPGIIGRALDAGALGVVIPMIQTAEDAKRAVEAGLYPPGAAAASALSAWACATVQDISWKRTIASPLFQ